MQILRGPSRAKASYSTFLDAERRRHGERERLDTLVVHAVNAVYSMSED